MESIKSNIRALPHANINPQGDCAPACIAGISGKTIQDIYKLNGRIDGLAYSDVIRVLNLLGLEYENFLPSYKMHSDNPEYFEFGMPSHRNFNAWWELSVNRMQQGMVGLAKVHPNGLANIEDYTNHFVIICGLEKRQEHSAKDLSVMISCPTKGEYEVPVKDFLWKYGGYNSIWVKPK